jgi:PIN domain nuclease of toxin-antitoxin system
VILDTHTLLWVDRNDSKLGAMARLQIEADWRAGLLVVSAISFWEATMLAERDRISLPTSPERWRANWLRAGLVEIPIDGRIALQSCQLTNFHRDPADRFIVATALDRNLPLMTADKKILEWEGTLNRLDASE